MKIQRVLKCAIPCLVAFTLTAGPVHGEDEALLPWQLRDHYTFAGENATMFFDVQRAIWTIDVKGLGEFIQNVQAEIVLDDGRTLRLSQLEAHSDQREKFTGPMGPGTVFRSTFKPHEGLTIRCAVARFTERPFLVLYLDVTNDGEEPVAVKAIRPAVVDAGMMSANGSPLEVTRIKTGRRGAYSTVHRRTDASLYQFELPTHGVSFALGVLQSGAMESRVNLLPSGDTWQGNVECIFDPPVVLTPGKNVQADPLWVSFGTPDPDKVRQFFGWAQSTVAKRERISSPPRGWFTVPDSGSANDLLQLADQWSRTSLRHVLAPISWEGRPGSMEGANPRFPKNMADFAANVKRQGMVPGITVDPLLVDGGSNEWTVQSASGATWLNPTSTSARSYGVQRLRKARDWGFEFFVVAPSAIPDEVLAHFDLTRHQADSFAFDIASEAAGEAPVVPSPSLTLQASAADWHEAADTTAWLNEYGVVPGPIRLEANGIKSVSDDFLDAVKKFGGPVEVVGLPDREARTRLAVALYPALGGIGGSASDQAAGR